MEKLCKLCGKSFISSKYRPERQGICSDPVCQHKRQLENMKTWRRNNPHYFKMDEIRGAYWQELYRRRIRKWGKAHPEYFRKYRERYKQRHKDYMREYMRRYRNERKKALMQAQNVQQQTDIAQPLQ